jgi:dihydrofolate reductase
MLVSLVVARARNGVIGKDNDLPWRLPADLAYFKRLTLGHPIVMGRRTWESIGRALPGRRNIVVTRTPGYRAPGAEVVDSLDAAWRAAEGAAEVFVIGGAALYESVLPLADRIFLTEVEAEVSGETRFPALDPRNWREKPLGSHPADDRNPYAMRFLLLERVSRSGD